MRTTGRTARWWVAALCVPLLFAAGCSDDPAEGDSGDEATSGSASPSESESSSDEPTEPEVPDAMANEDKAGAKAFVKYYWAMVDYAQVTGDVSGLRQLASTSCSPCAAGLEGIKQRQPRTQRVLGGDLSVHAVAVTPLAGGGKRSFRVDHSVKNSRQVIFFKNDKREAHGAADNRYRFFVSQDEHGHWRVGIWELPG